MSNDIIMLILGFFASFAAGFCVTALICRLRRRKMKTAVYILLSLLISAVLCSVVTLLYLGMHTPETPRGHSVMQGDDDSDARHHDENKQYDAPCEDLE